MTRRHLLLPAALAGLLLSRGALAQADMMHLAHVSSANQLGVMEYCMD